MCRRECGNKVYRNHNYFINVIQLVGKCLPFHLGKDYFIMKLDEILCGRHRECIFVSSLRGTYRLGMYPSAGLQYCSQWSNYSEGHLTSTFSSVNNQKK